jgi:methionine sulfoxide reductase heme-binding subunit
MVQNSVFPIQKGQIVVYTTIALTLMVGIIGWLNGFTETGVRLAIRLTARTSCSLFLLSFIASPLVALLSHPITRWLRANRRYLGLSVAISHAWHGIAIAGLAYLSAGKAISYDIGGVLGYVFLGLMTVTSTDQAKQWLGDRVWLVLHTVGAYYLWLAFLVAFGERWQVAPFYPIMVSLLVLAMVLRVVTWTRKLL